MTEPANPRQAVIVYHGLPVSSGGAHRLHEREPVVALQQLEAFLAACAQIEYRSNWLELLEKPGGWAKTRRTASLLGRPPVANRPAGPFREQASAAFGHPNRTGVLGMSDGSCTYRWEWRFGEREIRDAVHILQAHPVPDVGDKPAAAACVEARFLIKDPASGEVLAGQDPGVFRGAPGPIPGLGLGESRVVLRLDSRPTCSLCLSLPFPEVTNEVVRLAGRIQYHLPFRLSPHQWTCWQLDETATGYHPRKIALTPR